MRLEVYRLVPPAVGLGCFGVFAWLYSAQSDLYASALRFIGIVPFRFAFLDLSSLGADVDCWGRGINVYVENPCDVQGRVHNYSPLWLRAAFIPPGHDATMAMGVVLDLLFLLSLYWVFRPACWAETLLAVVCCCSTMSVFALERGNVDVLLFVFFVVSIGLASGPLWRRAGGYALILFAGLLKFYPVAALIMLARERPRWLLLFGGVAAAVVLAFVAWFKDELVLVKANIPSGGYGADLFGAANLPNAVAGLLSTVTADPGTLVIVRALTLAGLIVATYAGAVFWHGLPGLQDAYKRLPARSAIMMTTGAALVAGCFFAGQSLDYRGIFLLFVVAGLMELRRGAAAAAARCRRALAAMGVAIAVLMWGDMVRRASMPDGEGGTGLLDLVVLVRELMWWTVIGFLLAMIALFVQHSEGVAWLVAMSRRDRRHR